MFDLCPPFQIEGNLGGSAAITEMLVQSTCDEIRVLPALPRQWSSGSLKGVRVRGGAKLDITWNESSLTELRLHAGHSVKCRITYGDLSTEAQIRPGKPIVLDDTLRKIVQ
jgi:alpha-L-fucosidase 2